MNTTMRKVWLMNINDVTDDWLERRRSIAIEFSTEGVAHEYLTRAFKEGY